MSFLSADSQYQLHPLAARLFAYGWAGLPFCVGIRVVDWDVDWQIHDEESDKTIPVKRDPM